MARFNKYNAKAVSVDGIRFDSKREAEFYKTLKLQKEMGAIKWFLMQVPFRLPGNTTYRADFMVRYNPGHYVDDPITVYDVKGYQTQVFKIKKRQVEEIYGQKVEVI